MYPDFGKYMPYGLNETPVRYDFVDKLVLGDVAMVPLSQNNDIVFLEKLEHIVDGRGILRLEKIYIRFKLVFLWKTIGCHKKSYGQKIDF